MIQVLDEDNIQKVQEYRDFVINSNHGVVTQDIMWSKVKKNWGHLFLYDENQSGSIVATMAILTIEAVPGFLLAYVPKGPLVADYLDVDLINKFVSKAIKRLPKNVFLIRMDPEIEYSDELNQKYIDAGYQMRNRQLTKMHENIQPRLNMRLDLRNIESSSLLMDNFSKNGRRNVRKSLQNNLETKIGDSQELLDDFYTLHEMMAQYHGISYRPKNYFQAIRDNLSNQNLLKIYVSYVDGQPAEAMVTLDYGVKTWMIYAGLNRELSESGAAYKNRWEWLNYALKNRYSFADFGGIDHVGDDDGLYTNKRLFLGEQKPIEYIGEIDKVLNQEAYNEYLKQFKK
ncbi:MAG: peptidoglycan bridge formation glycyltransferase FemA/FemB family protein [Lactobacillaceae bacterium]|nr:peptidoglycan bridge formation glycyltransferase FemA/FemB family protein [Lactobacillaceae bacterium]